MQVTAGTQGLRLLALDNGGIRVLSELHILQEIMVRIQADANLKETPRPCHYFDLIGGSGSGGLIAIMLGRLEMSVVEAISAYVNITRRVISEKKWSSRGSMFKASALEAAIKELVKETCDDGEARMWTDKSPTSCKTFVCATSSTKKGGLRLFRSYDLPTDPMYNRNGKVWEAARATSAAPRFFESITIGKGSSKETFIDGGLGHNNPTADVVQEAKKVFGAERTVACIVNIGPGHPKIGLLGSGLLQRMFPNHLAEVTLRIATDCEMFSKKLERGFKGKKPQVYFRFNVQRGLQGPSIEEWEDLSGVELYTRAYLGGSMVEDYLKEIVDRLWQNASLPMFTTESLVDVLPKSL